MTKTMSAEITVSKRYDERHDEEVVFFDADELHESETVDGVGLYLDRSGKIARLSKEEEAALAKDIEAGKQAEATLAAETVLTSEEKRTLKLSMLVGRRAIETMVTANLRLVLPVATRYRGKGVPFSDLIQEGNLALLEAARKFDHTRGFKFSTYATSAIRTRIIRSFYDQGRRNSLQRIDAEQVSKMSHIQDQLTSELGRTPTREEIATAMKVTVEHVDELMYINQEPLYLEAPLSADGDMTLADVLENKAEIPSSKSTKTSSVDGLLSQLTERREVIVRGMFGLDESGMAKTYAEIAEELDVSESCVRSLHRLAMKDLQRIGESYDPHQ